MGEFLCKSHKDRAKVLIIFELRKFTAYFLFSIKFILSSLISTLLSLLSYLYSPISTLLSLLSQSYSLSPCRMDDTPLYNYP